MLAGPSIGLCIPMHVLHHLVGNVCPLQPVQGVCGSAQRQRQPAAECGAGQGRTQQVAGGAAGGAGAAAGGRGVWRGGVIRG
jgi:hypothetical protein